MGDPRTDQGVGMGTVLRTSVATLYANLVTRPTGEAVRVAIERQMRDLTGPALSILDFSHIGVIDFSCADEIVAKLLKRYTREDRPREAFFLAYGVCEHHREPIESALQRHRLLLVAVEDGRPELWGRAPARLRHAWHRLNEMGKVVSHEFAAAQGIEARTAAAWLRRLAAKRVAISEDGDRFASLAAALSGGGRDAFESMGPLPLAAAAPTPDAPRGNPVGPISADFDRVLRETGTGRLHLG